MSPGSEAGPIVEADDAADLAAGQRVERGLLWKEAVALALVAAVVVARAIWSG